MYKASHLKFKSHPGQIRSSGREGTQTSGIIEANGKWWAVSGDIWKDVKQKLIYFYIICFHILPKLAHFGDSCF